MMLYYLKRVSFFYLFKKFLLVTCQFNSSVLIFMDGQLTVWSLQMTRLMT